MGSPPCAAAKLASVYTPKMPSGRSAVASRIASFTAARVCVPSNHPYTVSRTLSRSTASIPATRSYACPTYAR